MWPFNKKKKVNIWKDIKCEFLRKQVCKIDCGDWVDIQQYRDWIPDWKEKEFYVYAIYQVSLTTENKQITEKFSEGKLEEFELKEYAEKERYLEDMAREARETNNYNMI